jgi:hypothetical protein
MAEMTRAELANSLLGDVISWNPWPDKLSVKYVRTFLLKEMQSRVLIENDNASEAYQAIRSKWAILNLQYFFASLGMEPRISCMLGKGSTLY